MELKTAGQFGEQFASGSDYSRIYEDAGQRTADPGAYRRYSRVIYLNFFFMVLEILGGSLAKSVAIINAGSMLVIDILTSFIRICGAYSLDRRILILKHRRKF